MLAREALVVGVSERKLVVVGDFVHDSVGSILSGLVVSSRALARVELLDESGQLSGDDPVVLERQRESAMSGLKFGTIVSDRSQEPGGRGVQEGHVADGPSVFEESLSARISCGELSG